MAQKDWKRFEGMESPGWYNVTFTNKKIGRIIVLSNSGEHEGENYPNEEWTFGINGLDGQPIEDQIQFSSKSKALAYAKRYMRTH